MQLGDFLWIELHDDLPPAEFGAGYRVGRLVAVGIDILQNEPVLELDDDGPRIYAMHIRNLTVRAQGDADADATPHVIFTGS
jgi:hypothetical protein